MYILTKPRPGIDLLSLAFPDDSTTIPLYRFNLPDGYQTGGFEITQDWETGKGTMLGIMQGQEDLNDTLFVEHIYTSWLVIRPEWKLVMPGESTWWDIVFAGDQMAEGRYNDRFFLAVNGFGEGGEVHAIMDSREISVRQQASSTPRNFGISSVYPNPFNASVMIRIELPESPQGNLRLYDQSGREVTKILNHPLVGSQTLIWDAGHVPSGIYFLKLTSGDMSQTVKLMLVR